jgi:hypothetical protein
MSARVSIIVALGLVVGAHLVTAIDMPLTREQMVRALTLARWPTSDADRVRFHSPYVVMVNGPTVQYSSVATVEVVTAFRRLELIAEDHARVNDMFGRGGLQDVEAAVAPWQGRVAIVVRLQFAPNGFITGVPTLDIRLEGPDTVTPVDDLHTTGIYGQSSMLIGGVVEALFDAQQIGRAPHVIIVSLREPAGVLARVPIDFRRLE